MAASSSEGSLMEDDISLRKIVIKKVEEYEKMNEGVIISKILPKGFVWHGTTCASFINKGGLLFGADGLARKFNPKDQTDNDKRILSKTEEKIFFIGERMLVSVSGNGTWIKHILGVLRPEIESKIPAGVDYWNCKRCAQFVRSSQAMGSDYVEKLYKLPPGSLKDSFCSMMFGAYENNEAKLFFGDDSCVEEILDGEVEHEMQVKKENQKTSWRSMGSGRYFADTAVMNSQENINIYYGDLSHVEDQLVLLLSAMRNSCDKNKDTGGVVQVYYMPPPPGVAHIIYSEFYSRIPIDIHMFKANMYHRLYESAREAGSFMAAGYLEKLLQCSDEYEKELQAFINRAKLKMSRKEQDQQLVEIQRRTKELAWFKSKWFKPQNLS